MNSQGKLLGTLLSTLFKLLKFHNSKADIIIPISQRKALRLGEVPRIGGVLEVVVAGLAHAACHASRGFHVGQDSLCWFYLQVPVLLLGPQKEKQKEKKKSISSSKQKSCRKAELEPTTQSSFRGLIIDAWAGSLPISSAGDPASWLEPVSQVGPETRAVGCRGGSYVLLSSPACHCIWWGAHRAPKPGAGRAGATNPNVPASDQPSAFQRILSPSPRAVTWAPAPSSGHG